MSKRITYILHTSLFLGFFSVALAATAEEAAMKYVPMLYYYLILNIKLPYFKQTYLQVVPNKVLLIGTFQIQRRIKCGTKRRRILLQFVPEMYVNNYACTTVSIFNFTRHLQISVIKKKQSYPFYLPDFYLMIYKHL